MKNSKKKKKYKYKRKTDPDLKSPYKSIKNQERPGQWDTPGYQYDVFGHKYKL